MNVKRWIGVIFFFAVFFRFTLALLNCDANDNHLEVVDHIISKKHLPEKNDCPECYQPPLYYIASAAIITALGAEQSAHKVQIMQLLNFILSVFILVMIWQFINEQGLSSSQKVFLYALCAFNPCLLAINIQSTNDTAAIFFGVLSVLIADKFFRQPDLKKTLSLAFVLIAGVLTKSNIIVAVVAFITIFMAAIFFQGIRRNRILLIKYFFVFLIIWSTGFLFGEGYKNYHKYGTLLQVNGVSQGYLPLFSKMDDYAQIQNIATGFFTFRYLDMIYHPYILPEVRYLHTTSLWSQLYGRTIFLHFDQWPYSWRSRSGFILTVGRILITIGIVPLFIFLAGLFDQIKIFFSRLMAGDDLYLSHTTKYMHLVITIAFLSSSVFYSYHLRDVSSMKSIFIFPAMLSFIKVFQTGYAQIRTKSILLVVNSFLLAIVFFSIIDVIFLIVQL